MSGRKVWVRCGITALIAVLLLCSSALAAVKYPFYTVTTDEVRLRKSASLKAIVVEYVAKGTPIEVLGKTGKFYRVSVEGTKGYIYEDYVSTAQGDVTTPVPASKATTETVSSYPYETVTTSAVNLRETKSTSSTSFAKIPSGAKIVVRALSGSWVEIEYGAYVGFVKSSYVALKKVADPTPTPTPVVTLTPEEDESSYQVLLKGSTGADVKALQQALIELGFLKGEADGKFGSATENALILFEQANDYPISVEADANLQAFLFNGKPLNSKGVATKVTVVSAVSGAVMQLGNTGDAVITLQNRLKELGYYTGNITGTYDKATKKAVMAFQKKNGLEDDGIAGKSTQDLLYSSSGMKVDETPTPSPTPTPTQIPTFTIPAGKVKQGTEGEDAKLVQKRLKELGYYKGRVDGKFGTQSVKALKNFQENNGMAVDGIAGEDTYKVMFSWGALAYGCTPTPVPAVDTPTPTPVPQAVTPTPTPYTGVILETLRKGDAGAGVSLMQEALINLGYLAGPADGIYGESTVKAVKNFQTMNGLKADGIAGNQTLTLLYSTGAKAAAVKATAAATATPAPASTLLKKGSKGDAVKELQQKLISLGYLNGTADGIFGTATYKALVAFQKANKLSTDGIAGSLTLSALSSSGAKGNTTASATATPTTSASTTTTKTVSSLVAPSASRVIYANWYTTVKAVCRKYPYATIYDFKTGISWQIHIFSLGAHADYEPLTANDTAKMEKVFGGNTWNPRAVWVIFADGSVYLGSTHSNPHGVQHITTNSFAGHSCLHFPRTQEQVEKIGTYATSHQTCIDKGWAATQAMK